MKIILLILGIYVVGILITYYIILKTHSEKDEPEFEPWDDEDAKCTLFFWPIALLFVIIVGPFELLKWLSKK